MIKDSTPEKPFLIYGFDIEISIEDSFTLDHVEGIFLLELKRKDGSEITARRIIMDESIFQTEPFDIGKYTPEQKEKMIRVFLSAGYSQADTTRILGLSHSYIGNVLRKKKDKP